MPAPCQTVLMSMASDRQLFSSVTSPNPLNPLAHIAWGEVGISSFYPQNNELLPPLPSHETLLTVQLRGPVCKAHWLPSAWVPKVAHLLKQSFACTQCLHLCEQTPRRKKGLWAGALQKQGTAVGMLSQPCGNLKNLSCLLLSYFKEGNKPIALPSHQEYLWVCCGAGHVHYFWKWTCSTFSPAQAPLPHCPMNGRRRKSCCVHRGTVRCQSLNHALQMQKGETHWWECGEELDKSTWRMQEEKEKAGVWCRPHQRWALTSVGVHRINSRGLWHPSQ